MSRTFCPPYVLSIVYASLYSGKEMNRHRVVYFRLADDVHCIMHYISLNQLINRSRGFTWFRGDVWLAFDMQMKRRYPCGHCAPNRCRFVFANEADSIENAMQLQCPSTSFVRASLHRQVRFSCDYLYSFAKTLISFAGQLFRSIRRSAVLIQSAENMLCTCNQIVQHVMHNWRGN